MTARISAWHSSLNPEARICVTSRILSKLSTRPKFLQFALMQNRDSVANVLHVGQQMAAHQNRLPFRLQLQNQIFHLARADGVQTAGRLVEQNQFGIVNQRLGQTKRRAMPLEYSRICRRRAQPRPDHFNQRCRPLLPHRRPACRTSGRRNRAFPRHSEIDTGTFLPAGSRCRSFFFTSVASLPSTIARPVVGNSRPNSSLMVVDLPEPLGPNSPKISPL